VSVWLQQFILFGVEKRLTSSQFKKVLKFN